VITYKGETVDQNTINWSRYPKAGFPYLLRQDPGPQNALGRIKFMFPNTHDVYLHDTPNKSLFDEKQRAFSSGCVRIEHPFEFAELLLNDDKWTKEKLMEVLESNETKQLSLAKPVTILLLYWTVKVEEDGAVMFKKDIYDRDLNILRGLRSPFKFRERPILIEKNI
jgi:murein L,D-transpeptidase YcbB/YkuD